MSGSSKRSINKTVFNDKGSNQGVQAGRIDSVTIHQETRTAVDEPVLYKYFCRLYKACNSLAFGDPQSEKPGQQMKLAEVFTMLKVQVRSLKRRGNSSADDKPPVIDALASERECILLGKPGGGKSTVVAFLALSLTEAQSEFSETTPLAGLGRLGSEWQTKFRSKKPPIPVRVVLKDVIENVWQGVRELWIEEVDEEERSTVKERLENALNKGQGLLLLDGLDEVPLDRITAVQNIIDDARLQFKKSRFLITCRVFDYDNELSRQITGLSELVVQDFDRQAQDQFIDRWYQELVRTGRRTEPEARAKRNNLKEGLRRRQELAKLTGTPLLLALVALVHTEEGELPSARSLFYQRCVRLLLLRWRPMEGVGTALDENRLLTLANEVGYESHFEEQQARPDAEESLGLSREQIRDISIRFFERAVKGKGEEMKQQAAVQGLTAAHRLLNSNGLLLSIGGDRFTFAHRTFQEFLAGQYLGVGSRRNLVLNLAADNHWRVALLLMAGYGAREGNSIDYVLGLIGQLLEGNESEQLLAAEMLSEVGAEPLRDKGYDYVLEEKGQWQKAAISLRAAAFESPRRSDLLVINRAAEILDLLDEDNRPSLSLGNNEYWSKRIEPGSFIMGTTLGSNALSRPSFLCEIKRPYSLARYPVTNRQYAHFLKDLSDRGEEVQYVRPSNWMGENYPAGQGGFPVALRDAEQGFLFADWAKQKLHDTKAIELAEEIGVPTEAEWERAASYPTTITDPTLSSERRRFSWETRLSEQDASDVVDCYLSRLGSVLATDEERLLLKYTYKLGMTAKEIHDSNNLSLNEIRMGLYRVRARSRRAARVVGLFSIGAADCGAEEMDWVRELCSTALNKYPLSSKLQTLKVRRPKRISAAQAAAIRFSVRNSMYDPGRPVVRGGALSTVHDRWRFNNLLSTRIGFRLVRRF